MATSWSMSSKDRCMSEAVFGDGSDCVSTMGFVLFVRVEIHPEGGDNGLCQAW